MLELESVIERKLKREITRLDSRIMCLKLESPGTSGMPDRMILLPGNQVVFVELKRPHQTERIRQRYIQKRLKQNEFVVFSSVSTAEQVEQIVAWCKFCLWAYDEVKKNEQSSV